MFSRSFTKAVPQLNQLKYKQLPPQIDFAILQDNIVTLVNYLIQHEELLPNQKHDSHLIIGDYGTNQFSIRMNDKGNDIIVEPLDSFSFKSIVPFQNKHKTPAEKHYKSLHRQSLLLNDTDVTSDDDDHVYSHFLESVIISFIDQLNDMYQTLTLSHSKIFSVITKPVTSPLTASVIDTTEPLSSHTSQVI